MSLGVNRYQILLLTVLATITTAATISLTYYLLSRPWCMQFGAHGEHTILYGSGNCEDEPAHHASPHAVSHSSIEEL